MAEGGRGGAAPREQHSRYPFSRSGDSARGARDRAAMRPSRQLAHDDPDAKTEPLAMNHRHPLARAVRSQYK